MIHLLASDLSGLQHPTHLPNRLVVFGGGHGLGLPKLTPGLFGGAFVDLDRTLLEDLESLFGGDPTAFDRHEQALVEEFDLDRLFTAQVAVHHFSMEGISHRVGGGKGSVLGPLLLNNQRRSTSRSIEADQAAGGHHRRKRDRQRRAPGAARGNRGFKFKQSSDSGHESTSCGMKCGLGAGAGARQPKTFKGEECFGEDSWLIVVLEGQCITTMFAFDADLAREPPGDGMKEQQAFDDALDEIDQVVHSAQMTELVQEHEFQLLSIEAGEDLRGHQNDRAQPADDHRGLNQAALEQPDRWSESELTLEVFEERAPVRIGRGHCRSGKAVRTPPLSEEANDHQDETDRPEAHCNGTGGGQTTGGGDGIRVGAT